MDGGHDNNLLGAGEQSPAVVWARMTEHRRLNPPSSKTKQNKKRKAGIGMENFHVTSRIELTVPKMCIRDS